MKYTYVKLHKYKRFPLLESDTFEKKFDSKVTMIAGSNGAGKSSLFNQLSPLPAERTDFDKGGYEILHIEKDKDSYILTSDFKTTPNYSFKRNGEELNTAGLVTMQRDLALQYFGINNTIHDILIGKENFTDMSLNSRKKLFSAITRLNIDEVLVGYNSLKENLKTTTLLNKTQLSNYKNEESKLIPKCEINERKKELKDLERKLEELNKTDLGLITYSDSNVSTSSLDRFKMIKDTVQKFTKNNYTSLTSYPNKEVNLIKARIDKQISVINYKLDISYTGLEKCKKELQSINNSTNLTRSELEEQIDKLTTYIDNRTKGIKLAPPEEEITERTLGDLYKLEATIPQLLENFHTNLQEDGTYKYTTTKFNEAVERKNEILTRLHQINAKEVTIKENLSKASSVTGNIECPSCDHSFPISDALSASIHKREELEPLMKEGHKLREELKVLVKTIEETSQYFETYKFLNSSKEETKNTLTKFWEVVSEEKLLLDNPSRIQSHLNTLNREIGQLRDVQKARAELSKVNDNLKELKSSESLSGTIVQERVDELELTCTDLQREKISLVEELSNISSLEEKYIKMENIEKNYLTEMTLVKARNLNLVVDSVREVLREYMKEFNLRRSYLENELNQIDRVNYTLDLYQKEIDKSEAEMKVLSSMVKELCPKNGLIAKSVSSFLNTIIHNVNNTLSKLWNYKMVLIPIEIGVDSLNYRFKVEVEDKLVINDISTVSRGMKEAINLSFRLVIYKLLRLDNYPLWLDEFLSSWDDKHSDSARHLLSNMINSDVYSQIFIINHKENFDFIRDMDKVTLG